MDERTGRLNPKMTVDIGGDSMYSPNQFQSSMRPAVLKAGGAAKRNLRNAKTTDIRAFLSDLKMLPRSQRKLLCKLLKRAAATAPGKVSVVPLADPLQTMKP
jgi:hypothetical protein